MTTSRHPYLLSGSFAYDTILHFGGAFEDSILPHAIPKLNVSFNVSSVKDEFGGTGGNIAHNAALLGQQPLLVGSLGADAERYLDWMREKGLRVDTLTLVPTERCAHAWILSDAVTNQITSFSVGAMTTPPQIPAQTPEVWHLAPENPLTSATLAREAVRQGKRFLFDPGQVLPAFIAGASADIFPLEEMLQAATGIFVNDYEAQLLQEATGKPLESWVLGADQFVVHTRGSKGVSLVTKSVNEGVTTVNRGVAPTAAVVDPTGCGDAFRAGFLLGYSLNWKLADCLAMGAVMGSFAIEHHGGQNHKPTLSEIWKRYGEYQAKDGFPAHPTGG